MDEMDEDERMNVRRQLDCGDPDLTQLTIGKYGCSKYYLPPDGDWVRDGRNIGRHTCIKELSLKLFKDLVPKESVEQFLSGVAENRSIETLTFYQPNFLGGELFNKLVPFFQSNEKIQSLQIERYHDKDTSSEFLPSVASALEQFGSLKTFKLRGNGVTDLNAAGDIIQSLAGHDNLQKLALRGFDCLYYEEKLELWGYDNVFQGGDRFVSQLATLLQNPRSMITQLDLSSCEFCDAGATALASGLAGNKMLQSLDLSECYIYETGWRAIFGCLQSCMLKDIVLSHIYLSDDVLISLAGSLSTSTTLRELGLYGIDSASARGWVTFWNILKDSSVMEAIESLNLGDSHDSKPIYDDEALTSFANALAGNKKLRELELWSIRGVTAAGWKHFSAALPSTMEELRLGNVFIDDEAMASLTQAFVTSKKLRELTLSNNTKVDTAGWKRFSAVLLSPDSALEKLDLGDNYFDDQTIISLTHALVGNKKLRELNLRDINDYLVTSAGWEHISTILRSPDSALEKLVLTGVGLGDETVTSFANSLANNDTLSELVLFNPHIPSLVTTDAWAAFKRILCGTSSIMATYNSNHTLKNVGDCKRLPGDVRSLLRINRENTKGQAARLKIIKAHFTGEVIDLGPFNDMELSVLPHAIEWITYDYDNGANRAWGKGLDLTYRLLSQHIVPTFAAAHENNKKRKRGPWDNVA